MKVGILLFEKWHAKKNIGSSRIRGHWLVQNWDEAELFEQGAKYDAIIFQKVYWADYCKEFDGIKILDVCDPDWFDGVEIKGVIDNCDAVTTSTGELRDEIKKFAGDKPVVYIPDRQDLKYHNGKKVHEGRAKRVVWFGYSHNVKVLDKTIGLLRKHNLSLTVLSDARPPYTKADRNVRFRWDKEGFNFNKIILGHDIVIMPPYTIAKGRFKSPNKTYTSWALGMPVATTPEELERFLDPVERQKEADKRYKEVVNKYEISQSVNDFKNLINQIHESRKR